MKVKFDKVLLQLREEDEGTVGAEMIANKVTSISEESTDIQYPSAKAMYTALLAKQASLGFTPENVANKSVNVTTDGASDVKFPSVKAVKDYADGLVAGLLDYRGGYDASGNTFPATGGSGPAGAVMKGDMWVVNVQGTLGGQLVKTGSSIIANVDAPAQTAGNWNLLNANISFAPEDSANKVTTISAGSTDAQYASAKLLFDQLALKADLISPTFTTPNIGSATGSVSGNAGTATKLATARKVYGNDFDGSADITNNAIFGVSSSADGKIIFKNAINAFTQTFTGSNPGASIEYVLPAIAPTLGQVMTASAPVAGVANLSWSTPATGGGEKWNTEVLLADKTLTISSTQYNKFQPQGSNRVVNMPVASGNTGSVFVMVNTSADKYVDIKDSNGLMITRMYSGRSLKFTCDGINWNVSNYDFFSHTKYANKIASSDGGYSKDASVDYQATNTTLYGGTLGANVNIVNAFLNNADNKWVAISQNTNLYYKADGVAAVQLSTNATYGKTCFIGNYGSDVLCAWCDTANVIKYATVTGHTTLNAVQTINTNANDTVTLTYGNVWGSFVSGNFLYFVAQGRTTGNANYRPLLYKVDLVNNTYTLYATDGTLGAHAPFSVFQDGDSIQIFSYVSEAIYVSTFDTVGATWTRQRVSAVTIATGVGANVHYDSVTKLLYTAHIESYNIVFKVTDIASTPALKTTTYFPASYTFTFGYSSSFSLGVMYTDGEHFLAPFTISSYKKGGYTTTLLAFAKIHKSGKFANGLMKFVEPSSSTNYTPGAFTVFSSGAKNQNKQMMIASYSNWTSTYAWNSTIFGASPAELFNSEFNNIIVEYTENSNPIRDGKDIFRYGSYANGAFLEDIFISPSNWGSSSAGYQKINIIYSTYQQFEMNAQQGRLFYFNMLTNMTGMEAVASASVSTANFLKLTASAVANTAFIASAIDFGSTGTGTYEEVKGSHASHIGYRSWHNAASGAHKFVTIGDGVAFTERAYWKTDGVIKLRTYAQAGALTTTELPNAGEFCLWDDTGNTKLFLVANHNGTIKKVELLV